MDINGGYRLKQFRQFLRLTQTDFAKSLGMAQNSIASFETGRRSLTINVCHLVNEKYGASFEWLMHGVGSIMTDGTSPFVVDVIPEPEEPKASDASCDPLAVALGNASESKMRVIQQIIAMSDDEWKPLYKALNALFGLPSDN